MKPMLQNPVPFIDGFKTIIAAAAMIVFAFYGADNGWHDPSRAWEMILLAAGVLGVRDAVRRSKNDVLQDNEQLKIQLAAAANRIMMLQRGEPTRNKVYDSDDGETLSSPADQKGIEVQ